MPKNILYLNFHDVPVLKWDVIQNEIKKRCLWFLFSVLFHHMVTCVGTEKISVLLLEFSMVNHYLDNVHLNVKQNETVSGKFWASWEIHLLNMQQAWRYRLDIGHICKIPKTEENRSCTHLCAMEGDFIHIKLANVRLMCPTSHFLPDKLFD